MANIKVALMRRVKTQAGWCYYRAAYSENGRVKPAVAVVAGEEVKHQVGYYTLRFCNGPRPVFEPLKGTNAAEAEARRRKKESQLSLLVAAKNVELKVEPIDPQSKLRSAQLGQFLAATIARGSLEAAEVYELACKEFLQVTGRRYVDELDTQDLVAFQKGLFARRMGARTVGNSACACEGASSLQRHGHEEPSKAPKVRQNVARDLHGSTAHRAFRSHQVTKRKPAVPSPPSDGCQRARSDVPRMARHRSRPEGSQPQIQGETVWLSAKGF